MKVLPGSSRGLSGRKEGAPELGGVIRTLALPSRFFRTMKCPKAPRTQTPPTMEPIIIPAMAPLLNLESSSVVRSYFIVKARSVMSIVLSARVGSI